MNTNDAYISLSQIRRLSILGNLLKKVTPKEREEDASFHQIIDSSMTKINNCFASNLNFSSNENAPCSFSHQKWQMSTSLKTKRNISKPPASRPLTFYVITLNDL